jgi:hypothetical protein
MRYNVTYELGTGGPLHKLENVELLNPGASNTTSIRLSSGKVKIINNRFIVETEIL